jgi:NodT family efflux transporter outer membrane factor (OMF) lipoprotein
LFFSLLLPAGGLPGCTVGPDYVPPEPDMPDAWHQALVKGLEKGEADLRAWWTLLEDPVLDRLIERATEGNLDLEQATARIQEARALVGAALGVWFPAVGATGGYERTRISEGVNPVLPNSRERRNNMYRAGLDASWEIDLWGRISRYVESADASLEATVENFRDILVILYAEVALSYIEARSLQARIRLALENVESQRKTLQLTRDRFNAGLVPELDVRQAELNLASTESVIPSLRILLVRELNRLGVLLGQRPGALHAELAPASPLPSLPERVQVAPPANLLRQRPDIRQAERELAAQTACIGIATADLYPRLSLSGRYALESLTAENFLDSGSRAWSFGPSVRWSLFEGGRIRSAIKAEEARTREALARYEQTVLFALEDVENALVSYVQEIEHRDALRRTVTASRQSVTLVETLYRTGLTDFQNVLDMQRSLFLQQDRLAESEGRVIQNLVRIYKALGGGWAPEAAILQESGSEDAE